jgi:hypothetical protein
VLQIDEAFIVHEFRVFDSADAAPRRLAPHTFRAETDPGEADFNNWQIAQLKP